MSNAQIDEMYDAIYDSDCEKIDALVGAGLSVDTRVEGDQWNFLHMALVSVTIPPDPNVVRHLIGLGVDVNARDRKMWTPLHFAVRTKNCTVVKMLVEAGAEIDSVNDEGITPLHQCLLEQSCNLDVVEMLLVAGADPDNDRGGGTVRNYANAVSRPETGAILELLDKYAKK
ncbi:ankyrin repeat domain-containing protein [Rubinisphaera margarita]|uniref:ankyrin repeat domain-containing protein n=1 Tax=Rubinisphaera margarita TaxID=2909586 RepID=UPI001EE8B7D9|nr:ankyrin repeat domain-containing protein [Rubinisphaera margarita]MCG6157764.1 ankyrin repeat domain-containing protein [Rubinisphaera margarita]